MSPLVRPLRESDLPEAKRIFRLAFGTARGLDDPLSFGGDRDAVGCRWRANPDGALAVELDGRLAGSNFATLWGSLGLFGPLSIHPDHWNRGLAQALLGPTLELLDGWGAAQVGIFTDAASPKHLSLYQRHGLWPRFLTAIMALPLNGGERDGRAQRCSGLANAQLNAAQEACRQLCGEIYPGLDLSREIAAVNDHGLGDTLLLWEETRLAAFAVCHYGAGSEGGSRACYVKFGAARPGERAGQRFSRLLGACQGLAVEQGLPRLEAGVNTARQQALAAMLAQGFECQILGVALHRPNKSFYNVEDALVMDDWR